MATPTRAQLALSLEPEAASPPTAPMAQEVIEALAELLLEAYGTDGPVETRSAEISDER